MNSYILVSKKQQPKTDYLTKFYIDNKIDRFDQIYIKDEGSIGIEIVRKLQEIIFLKPYKSEKKVIVVDNAQSLTIEAQNGLLKLLEEPPIYVTIFLLTNSEDSFLPTILSRCSVIKLLEEKIINNNDTKKIEEDFSVLTKGSISEKLALAENISSDKGNIDIWLSDMTLFVRDQMISAHDDKKILFAQILLVIQEAYKTISTTNVNPRVVLEHMLLEISN